MDWVKNRIIAYQIPDARPTVSANLTKRKREKDGEH
jgi:hypothetical protein